MYKFQIFELWNEEITFCSLKGQREKIQACWPGFRQLKISECLNFFFRPSFSCKCLRCVLNHDDFLCVLSCVVAWPFYSKLKSECVARS